MVKKRTYRAVEVESFDVRAFVARLAANQEVVVGLDVAKSKFLAALATSSRDVLEVVRFEHPVGTRAFLKLIGDLATSGHAPVVVMEPTGTYGDAIRHQLRQMGVAVHRVDTKHVSDSAELYDRVPSKHDAKDACVIAWLHSTGRSAVWTPPDDLQRRLRALVSQRDLHDEPLRRLRCQLEPLLARHFPEFESFFDISRRRTPLVVLAEHPSPADLAAAGSQAVAALVRRSSRRPADDALIAALVDAARNSLGVPMIDEERQYVRVLVTEMLRLISRVKELDAQIAALGMTQPAVVAMRTVLGATTAAVIVAHLGSPAQYSSAAAFEKAIGFNLREHSSGKHKGRLSISKRGPGRVRKYLFLAAMRLVQTDPVVKAWYARRRAYDDDAKMKALIAVARKLARSLVHVARGSCFDAALLFDARRLDLDAQRSNATVTTPKSPRNALDPLTSTPPRMSARPLEVRQPNPCSRPTTETPMT